MAMQPHKSTESETGIDVVGTKTDVQVADPASLSELRERAADGKETADIVDNIDEWLIRCGEDQFLNIFLDHPDGFIRDARIAIVLGRLKDHFDIDVLSAHLGTPTSEELRPRDDTSEEDMYRRRLRRDNLLERREVAKQALKDGLPLPPREEKIGRPDDLGPVPKMDLGEVNPITDHTPLHERADKAIEKLEEIEDEEYRKNEAKLVFNGLLDSGGAEEIRDRIDVFLKYVDQEYMLKRLMTANMTSALGIQRIKDKFDPTIYEAAAKKYFPSLLDGPVDLRQFY